MSAARPTTHAPATDARFAVPLRGCQVDRHTRCAHYDDPQDVIAIRFACCDVYYPCAQCHRATTDHSPRRLSANQTNEAAVLCGRCNGVMTAAAYLRANHMCPHCGTAFNPGCATHHDRYFAFV